MTDPNFVTDMVKVLGSPQVRALFGPTVEQAGIFLGYIAERGRHFATENIEKVFGKLGLNLQAEGRVLTDEEFRRILPLLSAASMQSSDELQERFAALLQSAPTADPNYLPGFAQTLEQISADEAQFLDRISAFLIQLSTGSKSPRVMEPLSESLLIYIYDKAPVL